MIPLLDLVIGIRGAVPFVSLLLTTLFLIVLNFYLPRHTLRYRKPNLYVSIAVVCLVVYVFYFHIDPEFVQKTSQQIVDRKQANREKCMADMEAGSCCIFYSTCV